MIANNVTLPKVTNQGDGSSLDVASVSEKEIIERSPLIVNELSSDNVTDSNLPDYKKSLCSTLLKLREKFNVSNIATEFITSEFKEIIDDCLSITQNTVLIVMKMRNQ